MNLKLIANNIYDICYDVDRYITGQSDIDSTYWARANSLRHAHTIKAILDYVQLYRKDKLKILNASGLSCGHQDFSIVYYFLKYTNIDVEWVVFESPASKYLIDKKFNKYLNDLNIDVKLQDFSKEDENNLYGNDSSVYDIIIFTEIAEHLDHSTLLKGLNAIRRKLDDNGILILTTPNLISFVNRIRMLLGNGDGPFWGDGMQNYKRGLYGHIVNYDIGRLKRLMEDIGYKINRSYTFTCGHGPDEKYFIKHIIYKLILFFELLIKNSGSTVLLVASKGDPIEIPFKI